MGASGSKEKLLNSLPETGERFYGLENFGNTCYANSVRPVTECWLDLDRSILLCGGTEQHTDNGSCLV